MKKAVAKKPAGDFKYSSKSKDLPATQGMLYLVRSELKSDIRGLRSEMKAGFSKMESKFSQVDARFNQVDSKFSTFDSRFNQMDAKFSDIDSRFNQMDAKFSDIDSRFNQMDAKFSDIDSRFNQMDSKFELVLSEVARVGTLIEEQNSRNQIVLEGLTILFHRQDRVESTVDEMQKTLRILVSRSRS